MVVYDFDVDSFSVAPDEADPVSVVDTYTVLAGAIFTKSLQAQPRTLEVMERRRGVQYCKFPIGHFRDCGEFSGADTVEDFLRLRILEPLDHRYIVYRITINLKATREDSETVCSPKHTALEESPAA